MRSIVRFAVMAIVGSICVVGCDDRPEEPAGADAAPAAPANDPAPPPQAPGVQPEYAVAIEQSETQPTQYAVNWSARVNTGGWKLTTDSVLVEETMGAMACRIWVTLEQPNPSEMVTQAIETLTGRHDAGTTKIERVEFSVRRSVRGVKYDTPLTYGVVKTIKYPN